MQINKQQNETKFLYRATVHQRIAALLVFLGILSFFGFLWLAATDKINIAWLISPCGLKQRYGIPCPTCGMTTCALAFVRGQIFESFYIQPAGAFFCCVMVVSVFFAFITTVFGVYFGFLRSFFNKVKPRYIILAVVVIIAAGWMVTLARALAEKM